MVTGQWSLFCTGQSFPQYSIIVDTFIDADISAVSVVAERCWCGGNGSLFESMPGLYCTRGMSLFWPLLSHHLLFTIELRCVLAWLSYLVKRLLFEYWWVGDDESKFEVCDQRVDEGKKAKENICYSAPSIDTATSDSLRYIARTKQRRTYLP